MDFRLTVFVTAAHTLNYSRTAEILKVSQPSVSKHIKTLEKEMGVKLFSRKGKNLMLTYAGELLMQKAETILKLYREFREEASLLSNISEVSFTIGIPHSIYYGIFPDLAADWCRLSPKSTINHKLLAINQISVAVKSGEVNFGIIPSRETNPENFFFTDILIPVTPSKIKEESYYDISDVKILMYEGDTDTSSLISSKLSSCGVNPDSLRIAATMKDPGSAIKFLIEYGKGSASASLPLVAFLWKSQIAGLLKNGVLKSVLLTEMGEMPPIIRNYIITGNQLSESEGFVAFAQGWAKRTYSSIL